MGPFSSPIAPDSANTSCIADVAVLENAATPKRGRTRSVARDSADVRRSPRFPAGSVEKGGSSAGSASAPRPPKKPKVSDTGLKAERKSERDPECFFVGDPVPDEEARAKWPHHYGEGQNSSRRGSTSKDNDNEFVENVKYHYVQASIVGCIFNLGDCAYIKGIEGKPNYVGKILEFFETMDGEYYFTVQWFYRATDTVLKEEATGHDNKRLFYSDIKNDNPLDCIVSKVCLRQVPSNTVMKLKSIPHCDYYWDMKYSIDYSTFHTATTDNTEEVSDICSCKCSGTETNEVTITESEIFKSMHKNSESGKTDLSLLDLFSGCGGMSTGLCLGAHVGGLRLVTRWAVDCNDAACKSLKLNHPETQVRNESAIDFLDLLKEWAKLCKRYLVDDFRKTRNCYLRANRDSSKTRINDISKITHEEFEVLKVVDICYGDPTKMGKRGLKFKVRWAGYGPNEDTWEPLESLSNCQDCIEDFVRYGFKSKILPLPGDVDVICGGPPCQGISGLNRHRNVVAPLEDEKNRQVVFFMDIVQFLKPKYVLMENVVDILRFANGTLGRYALNRLIRMKYQARLGIMAAGCYGLPQFRLRAFFWGAHPSKSLPQFPLPTHDVVLKGGASVEFERNVVAYDEGQPRNLEKALVLEEVLSDLPSVTSFEVREQMPYGKPSQTEFQRYIRSSKKAMMALAGDSVKKTQNSVLYDHYPLQLSEDNNLRICQIPRKKGACFRDLPGVVVLPDNTVQRDPNMERVLLPSGRTLVPDYCFTFDEGKSTKPFRRLWWDETVPTVLTTADPYFQAMIHPEEDRVLTVRENARLQGFPDYYRFCGTTKARYCQIGNAVAVPVARALGYAMAVAWQKRPGRDDPLLTLPPNFSHSPSPLQEHSLSSSEVA